MSDVIQKSSFLPVLLVVSASAWLAMAQAGTFTVLHAFRGGNDGASPFATLIPDGSDRFLSTAEGGGNNGCFDGCRLPYRGTDRCRQSGLYRSGTFLWSEGLRHDLQDSIEKVNSTGARDQLRGVAPQT